MTERELFKALYRIERMRFVEPVATDLSDESHDILNSEQINTIYSAFRAGLINRKVYNALLAAQQALRHRYCMNSLPSRNSVRIQMLVFTFGRVRRSF